MHAPTDTCAHIHNRPTLAHTLITIDASIVVPADLAQTLAFLCSLGLLSEAALFSLLAHVNN